jgi:hypothetical protein
LHWALIFFHLLFGFTTVVLVARITHYTYTYVPASLIPTRYPYILSSSIIKTCILRCWGQNNDLWHLISLVWFLLSLFLTSWLIWSYATPFNARTHTPYHCVFFFFSYFSNSRETFFSLNFFLHPFTWFENPAFCFVTLSSFTGHNTLIPRDPEIWSNATDDAGEQGRRKCGGRRRRANVATLMQHVVLAVRLYCLLVWCMYLAWWRLFTLISTLCNELLAALVELLSGWGIVDTYNSALVFIHHIAAILCETTCTLLVKAANTKYGIQGG